jgi:hypothetical protein
MSAVKAESLEHGSVTILRGKNKGKTGYYDDDEGDKAIVYLGEPFKSEYILLSKSSIKNVVSVTYERFKIENREFCKKMGIP